MHAIQTARRLTVPSVRPAVLCCLFLCSLTPTMARAAEPSPSPHRFIPASGLVAYVDFDGLDAHADAWKATAAHGLLVKTPAGSMMTELAKQVLDRLFKTVPGCKATGGDLIALNDHLMQRGFVVAVYSHEDSNASVTVVLNGFGEKPIRQRLERLLQLWLDPAVTKLPASVRLRGRDVYQVAENDLVRAELEPGRPDPPAAPISPWLSWWYEGDELVLITGPWDDVGALLDPAKKKTPTAAHARHRAAVLDVIEGKQPNIAMHAAYVSALAQGKDIKGFEPDGLFFIEHPLQVELVGLDGIKRIAGRWGFQGKALLTDVRVEAPAPRKGLVAWLDQPAFRKDRLPPIPRNTSAFAIDSLDPAASFQKVVGALTALVPELDGEIVKFERAIREATGLQLRQDLLNQLGPTWSVLRLPSLDRNRGDRAEFDPTAYALLAGVHDASAFGKVLDSMACRANQYLRDQDKSDDKKKQGKKEADPPILALERLPAPDRGYQLTSPAQLISWLDDDVRPTILIGKSFVACASNLERAREALAAESQAGNPWRPAGELTQAFECLPEGLTFLAVGDPRDSAWPDAIAQLPSAVQALSAMLKDFSDDDSSMAAGLLGAIGIPRPGGFRVRIDPSRIPTAEQLRPYLFPSVLAATVDDRGFRLIGREAFPLACIGNEVDLTHSTQWSKSKGLDSKLKLGLGN